jgi:hypothetical protein
MVQAPESLLNLEFGGTSVRENLERAIAEGRLVEREDGTIALPAQKKRARLWVRVPNGPIPPCPFYKAVLFNGAYAGSAVPHACRDCYKVKARPRTLAQLVAAWHVAQSVACLSKWGIDFGNRYSQDIYAGYFYTDGLDAARVLHAHVRRLYDADPRLGADVGLTIKRGCSEFEAAVGPSDTYSFTPEMAELEAVLCARVQSKHRAIERELPPMPQWIQFAFQIGDDSYLKFTGGERLRPASVSYDPLDTDPSA